MTTTGWVVAVAEVTSLSDDHWCLTDDVQDLIKIPDKGSERDFEGAIERATNSVQSWWKTETGKTDLPDASSLHDLLVEATAWLAVSESTFSYARNFNGGDGSTDRTRTADDKAHTKFNEWTNVSDVSSSEAATEGEATDTNAQSGALIDEF